MSKKLMSVISIVLVLVLTLGLAVTVASAQNDVKTIVIDDEEEALETGESEISFTDLKSSHWAFNAVSKMFDLGVVKGYADGTFKPSGTVTYGEFIKMVVVQLTGEDPGNSSKEHWAYNYFVEGVRQGLYDDVVTSMLSKEIPRYQMAKIITKALGNKSLTDSQFEAAYAALSDIADWNKDTKRAIAKAYGFGIITGYEDGTFRPNGTLTRAEAATVIYRLIDEDARVIPDLTVKKHNGSNSSTTDTAKKPISDIYTGAVKGYFTKINDNFNSAYEMIKYYEVLDNFPCTITIEDNLVGKDKISFSDNIVGLKIEGIPDDFFELGIPMAVIIKDKTAYQAQTGPNGLYFSNSPDKFIFPEFDYIGLLYFTDTMYLIPYSLVTRA